MRARDLLDPSPVVHRSSDALDVVRRLVAGGWDGLVVVDDDGPVATVSLAQVLRLALPDYIEDDVSLASVYAEKIADSFGETMRGRPVSEVLPWPHREPVVVRPTATLLEVAALMATEFTAIVAVVEDGRTLGAVGARALMRAILPP